MISCCWVIMNISEVPWHQQDCVVLLWSCQPPDQSHSQTLCQELVHPGLPIFLQFNIRCCSTPCYETLKSTTCDGRTVSSTTFLQNTPVEPAQHAEAREQFPPRPDNQVITSAWLHSSKVFSHINQSEPRIGNTSTNQKWQRVEAWDDGSSYA